MSAYSSKYDQYREKDAIFPHKHCPVCSHMVPEEGGEYGEYCSLECQGYVKGQKKGKKRQTLFMIIAYVVMIGALVLVMFLNRT